MSIDAVSLIDMSTNFIGLAILLLAAFRGVEIGKAFISRVYRNRALWIAALCVAFLLQSQVPNDVTFGGLPMFELTFFLMFALILVFVDSTIMVTLEMDFFHRNTLRWKQLRFVFYPVSFGFIAAFLFFTYLSGLPNPPAWVSTIANGPLGLAFFVVFGFSVITLIVGARRTPDRTLKRHITLLGFVLLIFIITTLIFNYLTIWPIDLLNDFLGVLSPYLLYRAVMTLSPLSRIQKEVEASSNSAESGDTLPSHP